MSKNYPDIQMHRSQRSWYVTNHRVALLKQLLTGYQLLPCLAHKIITLLLYKTVDTSKPVMISHYLTNKALSMVTKHHVHCLTYKGLDISQTIAFRRWQRYWRVTSHHIVSPPIKLLAFTNYCYALYMSQIITLPLSQSSWHVKCNHAFLSQSVVPARLRN